MIKSICKWFRELGNVYTMTDWARDMKKIDASQREADKRFLEILSLLSFE